MELYLHIPFCVRKCDYCDFLSFPTGVEEKEQYVQELIKEIRSWKDRGDVSVSSVFIGGGTPSILKAEQIGRIMQAIKEEYDLEEDAEITMEANPGTLDSEKLAVCKEAGINRLSIGLQSAQNEELKLLGRIHTWEEFLESFSLARRVGFSNINVDLMSALPGQKEDTWEDTLQKVLALKPEHISAYGLIVEEGTPFFSRYVEDLKRQEAGEDCLILPSEEAERRMYQRTKEMLGQCGYERYEISNYAKQGKACRHNMGYWDRKEYKGFGLGAASLLKEIRYVNNSSLNEYLNGHWTLEEAEALGKKEQMEEQMFLGLRMMRGVSEAAFAKKYGISVDAVYGDVLKKMCGQELLWRKDGWIRLTEKGIDISNYVLSHFLLD